MADYIYLLENRLSAAQQHALTVLRDLARNKGLTIFLTGGAVRDLTGGASVRDLDVTVQGNALKFKKELEKAGATIDGEYDLTQSLFLTFPGGVRVELASALSVTYPKPGKPVYTAASILDDLRRRDFTANAMAISLNDGSYGLLMDPLNGVADIENREFRLVSNYGFIEDPVRLIRLTRLGARLGWQMEEKTRARYQTAKDENYISALSPWLQGYELEEIAHEEDSVRALRILEAEGWMKSLFPAWGASKANAAAINDLLAKNGQLQQQGILAYPAAIQFPLLTAKLQPKDVTTLKKMFPRQGFVQQIASMDARTREFQNKFTSKEATAPSAAWKLLHSADPEMVLSLYVSGKGAPIQNKYKAFLTDWPTAKQRIPYALLTEMRITPDLPIYNELLDKLFFELMDNKLGTVEEMKAYLEPFSPPAPPPPVNLRRARAKKEAKAPRGKAKKAAKVAAEEGPEPMSLPNVVADVPVGAAPARDGGEPKPSKKAIVVEKVAPAKKAVAVPVAAKKVAAAPAKKTAAPAKKAVPAKAVVKKAAPAKKIVTKKATPAKKVAAKKPVAKKAAVKAPIKKVVAKTVKKAVPAKKPVAKKTAPAKKSPAKKKR
jgi:tRNA nucleotidyltransferase/poly(A) polymerase